MRRIFPLLTTLIFALSWGGSSEGWANPRDSVSSQADDDGTCKRRRRRRRRSKKKKVSAKTIRRWQKKGWSNGKIVYKAMNAKYKVSKRELRRLKKARVRKSLRRALRTAYRNKRGRAQPIAVASARSDIPVDAEPEYEELEAQPANTPPVKLNRVIHPNEIRFEDVPPPKGIPARYAE